MHLTRMSTVQLSMLSRISLIALRSEGGAAAHGSHRSQNRGSYPVTIEYCNKLHQPQHITATQNVASYPTPFNALRMQWTTAKSRAVTFQKKAGDPIPLQQLYSANNSHRRESMQIGEHCLDRPRLGWSAIRVHYHITSIRSGECETCNAQ
jgi:hypothetical protein